MRTIKFRGKTRTKWAYGYLAGEHLISEKDELEYTPIIKDTVGQFTGLYDKNGKEIYEGDIIQFKDSTGLHTEEVKFDKGCFYAGKHGGSSTRVSPKLINTRIAIVIGNIYDNKDLLEEKKANEMSKKI